MNKDTAKNVFIEVYNESKDFLTDENKFNEKFKKYQGTLIGTEVASELYTDTLFDCTKFIWEVLKRLMDSDDFKRELFNDMMEQAKDEAKRTQRNPFEV